MRRNRKGGIPGLTLKSIADKLNSEGIFSKEGSQWTPTQVHRALLKKVG